MLFSRSSSQSSDDTGSSSGGSGGGMSSSASESSSSAASSRTSTADHQKAWLSKGAANLGVISSLAEECTPRKHKYDACFDLWFRDYLAIGDSQIAQQEAQHSAASTRNLKTDTDVEARKKSIMQRYENDCGSLFRDYQSCVKVGPCSASLLVLLLIDLFPLSRQKAISDRDLDGLITQARKENPFPFDHERKSDPSANNPPFPFPAARE